MLGPDVEEVYIHHDGSNYFMTHDLITGWVKCEVEYIMVAAQEKGFDTEYFLTVQCQVLTMRERQVLKFDRDSIKGPWKTDTQDLIELGKRQ